jgi:hypothetical protein
MESITLIDPAVGQFLKGVMADSSFDGACDGSGFRMWVLNNAFLRVWTSSGDGAERRIYAKEQECGDSKMGCVDGLTSSGDDAERVGTKVQNAA